MESRPTCRLHLLPSNRAYPPLVPDTLPASRRNSYIVCHTRSSSGILRADIAKRGLGVRRACVTKRQLTRETKRKSERLVRRSAGREGGCAHIESQELRSILDRPRRQRRRNVRRIRCLRQINFVVAKGSKRVGPHLRTQLFLLGALASAPFGGGSGRRLDHGIHEAVRERVRIGRIEPKHVELRKRKRKKKKERNTRISAGNRTLFSAHPHPPPSFSHGRRQRERGRGERGRISKKEK